MYSWTPIIWVWTDENRNRVLRVDMETRETNGELVRDGDLYCASNIESNKMCEEKPNVMEKVLRCNKQQDTPDNGSQY